jgi:hypothetical protein
MGHLRLCVYLSSLVSVLVLLCVNPVLILLVLLPICPVLALRLLVLWVYLLLLLGRELVWLFSVAPSVIWLVGSRNVPLVK